MNELPSQIDFVELPGGAHYRLPRRNLGGLRFLGLFFLLFGLFFAGFAVAWMAGALGIFWDGGHDAFDWVGVVFALFGIPFVLAGLAVMGIGLAIVAGRSEIVLQHGQVRAIERAGPFRLLSWQRPAEQIRRFVVASGNVKVNHKPVRSGPLADLAAIKMEGDGTRPVLLAPGYPRQWLLPLAEDLARRCDLQEPTSAGAEATPIEVVEERQTDETFVPEQVEKPAGSQVLHQEDATGVTLTVPPAGVWKGSKGLFSFGIFWLGFIGLLSGFMLFGGGKDIDEPWILLLVLGLFWAVGLGLLLGGLNMGKRRAVLAVVGDRLLLLQTGIFGSKRREWARDQLDDVQVGPSGMEVNNVPVIELQIQPKEGGKVGLLAGRDNDELRWLACVLRNALRLGPAPRPDGPPHSANRIDAANVQDQ